MDNQIIELVIETISAEIEQHGKCSIKTAAEKSGVKSITLREQKKIAKLMVKSRPLLTELIGSEIVVTRNNQLETNPNKLNKGSEYTYAILAFILAIVLAAIFRLTMKG